MGRWLNSLATLALACADEAAALEATRKGTFFQRERETTTTTTTTELIVQPAAEGMEAASAEEPTSGEEDASDTETVSTAPSAVTEATTRGATTTPAPSKERKKRGLPVAFFASRVALPRRPMEDPEKAVDVDVPRCAYFNSCVDVTGDPEQCCDDHLDSPRDCGLCVKAACFLRADFCPHPGAPEGDKYCELCFTVSEFEQHLEVPQATRPAGSTTPVMMPPFRGASGPPPRQIPTTTAMPPRMPQIPGMPKRGAGRPSIPGMPQAPPMQPPQMQRPRVPGMPQYKPTPPPHMRQLHEQPPPMQPPPRRKIPGMPQLKPAAATQMRQQPPPSQPLPQMQRPKQPGMPQYRQQQPPPQKPPPRQQQPPPQKPPPRVPGLPQINMKGKIPTGIPRGMPKIKFASTPKFGHGEL